MGKQLDVGVSNVARKGKKVYVGVNNVARKGKKAWIGDASGIAREFFSGFTPAFLAEANNSLYYSEDAVNWSVKKTFTHEIKGMVFVNGKYYVAARYYQYIEFYTSEDGSTWTNLSRVDPYAMGNGNFKYLNGKFFMWSDNSGIMYYSSDCVTWTAFTINEGAYNNSSYSSYSFGYVFDMEYGTVNGITAYYVVRYAYMGAMGCALCRYNTFDDLISGYNYEAEEGFKVLDTDIPSEISYFSSPNVDAALVINSNKAYIAFSYYCTSLDRYMHKILKYASDYWTVVQSSSSYIIANLWSTKDKLIYDRMYYSSGRTWVAKMAFNYSTETAPMLTVPTYPCHYDMVKYPCADNILVGVYGTSIFYSLDGGSTFTLVTISSSSTAGVAIYGTDDGGFYTER